MEEKIKVSIIVPVYNAEKYLRECLDSLINQKLPEIEIICVNDGSTDSSPQILEEYSKKDLRVKVFNQEHKGVSVARNNGINKVQGEYLTFVDADDFLDLNALKMLYTIVKQRGSDLLLFSYFNCYSNSMTKDNRLVELASIAQNRNIKFVDYYKELFKSPLLSCGKLYRTELIRKNKIFYPLDIQCSEDRVFAIKAFIESDSISVFDIGLYYYRLNANQSLTKNSENTIKYTYEVSKIMKRIIYSSDKIPNKDDIYVVSLYDAAAVILYHWDSAYNTSLKRLNLKYIYKIKNDYKPYSHKSEADEKMYVRIKNAIRIYWEFYFKKLFEPIIEIEHRNCRRACYLFGKQVLNYEPKYIKTLYYIINLIKLRFKVKFKKIKVAFFVTDVSKWTCQSLYDEFKKSKYFEPIVYLSIFKDNSAVIDYIKVFDEGIEFFKKRNIETKLLYDKNNNKFLPIKNFKSDILFYQQPWGIDINQGINFSIKYALLCYIPYCFYSMDSFYSYMQWFHGRMWKYFVETPFHKEEYERKYQGYNCKALGSIKLDNYKSIDMTKVADMRKSGKKRIIYAPHHSVSKNTDHAMATFAENGMFILELAKKHPEVEWIFRPHPIFTDSIIKYGFMSNDEVEKYYEEWKKIGTLSTSSDNYYELFMSSDCLITDCISFLAEYLPANKPVIHLRRKEQLFPFNDLLKNVIEGYYQIHNNEELEKTFNEVIINGNDYLKDVRSEKVKYLMIDENKTAACKIREYLESELRVK